MSQTASPLQQLGVRGTVVEALGPVTRSKSQMLRFGVFELDTATDELRKEGRLIHVRHQPVQVLRLLLRRAGDLVTRKELISVLWPDDIDVDVEQGLNHCVKEIRAALGDPPHSPRFIQTLPRRGYRFLFEVHHDGFRPAVLPPDVSALGRAETALSQRPALPESVRVQVRVVVTRSGDDAAVWTQNYARGASDLGALERDVTQGIRSAIRFVPHAEEESIPRAPESDPPLRDRRFE